jgi:hypothetical protein
LPNNANGGSILSPSPERSDFDFAYDRFLPSSTMRVKPELGDENVADGVQELLVDPFNDGLEPPLPSPMASSAARSLFFPAGHPEAGSAPTNLTRVARSWTPSSDAPEEMAVLAGEIVRVISRHSIYQDAATSPSEGGVLQRDSNATLGGWALVKKTDPITGIGRRGFVPVNCLMDV